MIRITRRRVLLAVLALFFFGVGYVAWTLAGLPPVKYYFRYGLDPYCEPTGEKVTLEGVEFIEIGPGIFRMGSTYLAEGGDWLGRICAPLGLPWGEHPEPSDEMPVHWVEFRKGFWIATTEITNAQYEQFRPEHEHERDWPRQGDDYPITEVTWTEAKAYCSWLAAKTRRPIRLPSEAEWESACRGGSDDEFTFGDDAERLSEYAWFDEDRESGPWAVATKEPNRWDLFDLHGNAWEWCEDTLHSSYRGAPTDGAAWVSETPPLRVIRGGDWRFPVRGCRSAHRNGGGPERRNPLLGFRPAFSNPDD